MSSGPTPLVTADWIFDQGTPEPGAQRRQMLDDMRQAVITKAMAACHVPHDAGANANEAYQCLLVVQTARD